MSELVSTSLIDRLQEAVSKLPQLAVETQHYFADGLYCRWVFRRAGTLTIGKVHKKQHFYLVIQGCVEVAGGPDGPVRLTAPALVVSEPGTKRAVYALEDSVCITVHHSHLTDIEALEDELVEHDPRSMYGPGNTLKALEHQS
jgi:hypothetical protein